MKPVVLIIIDGYGLAVESDGNALNLEYTPNLKALLKPGNFAKLKACGRAVGLPDGQMGNSEVGHLTLGAGRVVSCLQSQISEAVKTGEFFKNPVLVEAMERCQQKGSALHLMGLVSDGGVHSQLKHLFALLEMAGSFGVKQINLHGFLDGRDTPPRSGLGFVRLLQERASKTRGAELCTLVGRYFAMDRDSRKERTEIAFEAIAKGKGRVAKDPQATLKEEYEAGKTDEFVEPLIFKKAPINPADSIIFFNFRADRARQLTKRILLTYPDVNFVCLADYGVEEAKVAFFKTPVENSLSEWVSRLGLRQLKIAETEKYAHVTYFFSGGSAEVFEGEDRVLVPSPKVKTYDEKPEMSAFEITEVLEAKLAAQNHELLVVNYANCDMVGHTGKFGPAVLAAKAVDACVSRVINRARELKARVIVTADHGNAEKMKDEKGEPFTAHTCNLVPFVLVGNQVKLRPEGGLQDVAPTVLELLGQAKPPQMLGQSLICG